MTGNAKRWKAASLAVGGIFMLAACGPAKENANESADVSAEGGADAAQRNKEAAQGFYQDLWFTDNTDRYADYVAESYVVHDLGARKNVTEQAVEQKNIADLFHSFGDMTGEIDYQIAEDDMVATRWFISLDPSDEAEARGMTPVDRVAIINVFRFNDEGKIVEIWNHRHDVELPRPPER
ncbi:ester cyclase [Hyphococcus sp.]|uniref:ester cyclase n=1 Tax=Hyphococcus sp. TaxID=2038636 RepID=UPI003CCB7983